jgi:hypothetical protein
LAVAGRLGTLGLPSLISGEYRGVWLRSGGGGCSAGAGGVFR